MVSVSVSSHIQWNLDKVNTSGPTKVVGFKQRLTLNPYKINIEKNKMGMLKGVNKSFPNKKC